MSYEVLIIILLLTIPTYIFSNWVVKKNNIEDKRNRRIYSAIATIIISPIIYVFLVFSFFMYISYYPSKDFDKSEWNTNIETRYEYSEDIIESKILIGKTKEQVIELLGVNYLSSSNDNQIEYELGYVPGLFNIDPDFLQIKLQDNKVIEVYQIQS